MLLQVSVLREVAERLLTVRDLDQVLLTISDRTLELLDADICGVMLREGEEVRMRCCVGHRVVETGRLRMRAGQGLAGLVLRHDEPARVDSYLDDRSISSDFMTLAQEEQTRSALAVPLRLQGVLIGVLEVWRRRPQPFTDDDEQRMVALAAFATIAIDNARLLDAQTSAVVELQGARDALQEQVQRLARASRLQHQLLSAVAAGGGLDAIAGATVAELAVAVGIYGPDGQLVAHHSGPLDRSGGEVPGRLPSGRPHPLTDGGSGAGSPLDARSSGRWVERVVATGDELGAVCLLTAVDGSGEPAALMEVAVSQVAMACSLTQLRERASHLARAESLDELLWDLVQGPRERRAAARTRARQLHVALRAPLRVLLSRFGPVDESTAVGVERSPWDVQRTLQQVGGRRLLLCGVRGDLVVGVVSHLDTDAVRALVSDLSAAVREQTGLESGWGVSRPHDDSLELCSALGEARTALAAAQRLGRPGPLLYEELGIVRLLLGSDDPDLQVFIEDVVGPLLTYDRENDGSLIRTLRAYFEADCSQRAAAEHLFVHHKTLRYRLERIKELTGLDLSRHEDRVRADVALRLLQVGGVRTTAGG